MATYLLIIIYLTFISLGLPDAVTGSLWPAVRLELDAPVSMAGLISMLTSGGTILTSFFSGKILRRFGTGSVTLVSVLLTAAGLFGMSFAPSFAFLLLTVIPLGLGAGAIDSALNTFIVKNYETRHMNWLHCFWGVGAMGGPLILSQIYALDQSWRSGLQIIAGYQIVLALILLCTLPFWKRVETSRRRLVAELPEPTRKKRHIRDLIRLPGVTSVMFTFFIYCGLELTINLWCPTYLMTVRGLSASNAALWSSFFLGGIMSGRFLAGFLSIKIPTTNIIRYGLMIAIFGIILMLVPGDGWFFPVGILLCGLGCAPFFPGMMKETPARFGSQNTPDIIGFEMAAAYSGSTLLAPLFGWLFASSWIAVMPWLLLVYSILILFSAEKVLKSRRTILE